MKLPLSNRLLACCGFVSDGDRVADVGCDHGYLGIHLLQEGIASFVIASDIHEKPLEGALHNAYKSGVQGRMSFYQSNGLRGIPRDFDSLVCAGMGADTIISILDEAPWIRDRRYRLILQCQSRTQALRKYLCENGFSIVQETLAQDGKFLYPVMEVRYAPGAALTPGGLYISPALLRSGSPLLPAFWDRTVGSIADTVAGLARSGGEKYERFRGILTELLEMEGLIYGGSR